MKTGLLSVTFRKLSPEQIVQLCREAQLESIEWGGDIHVPPGDEGRAVEVGAITREAGLSVAAYGSYYRLGVSESIGLTFSSVLKTAATLGSPSIRVWAGNRNGADADEAWRNVVAADALRCADLAAAEGILLAYEFHSGTLTDTAESAVALLEATSHPFIRTLWQPPVGHSLEKCVEGLRRVNPWVLNVHAFHWWPDSSTRLPLREGADRWAAYVQELRAGGRDPGILLEFVRGDDPAALADDAAALREILNQGS
ncbi:MAG: sugar phosphate isomerase/epimerase family protein [Terrimicrobiaceae bacterium]